MQKIIPFLWFNDQAEEAMNFYTSIFKDAKIVSLRRSGPGKDARVFTGTFQIEGQEFYALNGGPHFKFSPANSFFVSCSDISEIETLWQELSQGGTTLMPLDKYPSSEKFGWIQDKFGISWQLNLGDSTGPKIKPFLMCVNEKAVKAEEAMQFYNSVFNNSNIVKLLKYGPGEGGVEGTLKMATFNLENQTFMASDSHHPHAFGFTPAFSFFVHCTTQTEVDMFWDKLSAGGAKSQCGWLTDKFGVSWQIIPNLLGQLLGDKDPVKSARVMKAMLQMHKIDMAELERAYKQE